MLVIILKSLIVGAVAGFGVGAGAARMFFAPKVQAAGAFRTIGEMNACLGDAVAHFSFGLSFYLNCAVQGFATGCFEQDFLHRVVPNMAAGVLTLKNKNYEETVYDPAKMGIIAAIVSAVLYTLLNCSVSFVPAYVSQSMGKVFTSAINNMLVVMQVLYLIAALDNGVITGCWGIVLGSIAYLVTGNATPGLILGILTGKTIELNGVKSKVSIVFIVLMILVWGSIAYFRGFFPKLLAAFALIGG